jgi:hypothetical protein
MQLCETMLLLKQMYDIIIVSHIIISYYALGFIESL